MPRFDDLQIWVPTRKSISFWDSPYGAELDRLETLGTPRGPETKGREKKKGGRTGYELWNMFATGTHIL